MSTVNISHTPGPITIVEIERLLEQYDGFITTLARQAAARTSTRLQELDMEIDEIAQMTRIKLWNTLQKTRIDNLKAYIRRIVHNEAINRIRQRKDVMPLLVDEHNEITQEYTPVAQGESQHDPAQIFEQGERVAEHTCKLVALVIRLPQRQQRAMVCALKERVDDLHTLTRSFRRAGKNIETIQWPDDKADENRLRASLSFTRKRLRPHFEVA